MSVSHCLYTNSTNCFSILSFYNTIANKGRMVRPHLLDAIYNKTDTLVVHRRYTEVLREEVFSVEVADSLTRALLAVTESGTGTRLREARYTVAGKTGTARQIIQARYDDKGRLINPYFDDDGRFQTTATYAGFFPADNPKYSISVSSIPSLAERHIMAERSRLKL